MEFAYNDSRMLHSQRTKAEAEQLNRGLSNAAVRDQRVMTYGSASLENKKGQPLIAFITYYAIFLKRECNIPQSVNQRLITIKTNCKNRPVKLMQGHNIH